MWALRWALLLSAFALTCCAGQASEIPTGSFTVTVGYHEVFGDQIKDGSFPYQGNITRNAVALDYFGFLACGNTVDTLVVNDSVYDIWGIWAVTSVTGTIAPDGTAMLHVHEQVYADDPASATGYSVGTPLDEDYTFSDLKPITHGRH